MNKKIRQLILHIRKFLVGSKELRNEYKKIILTLQISAIAGFACVLFTFLDYYQGYYQNMFVNMSAVLVFIFSIFLITKGKFNIGKMIILVYSCMALVVNASKDGRNAGNEFLWFPIISGVFLFFTSRDRIYMITCFAITFSAMLWMELTDYSYYLHITPGVQYKYLNYIICLVISVMMLCLFMYYLIKVNADSERKLSRLNATLLNRNEKLRKINSELDSFVYKASHDMRAPLTSLLGLLALSKKENELGILRGFLEMQEKTILKLDSYILDILDMSRNARMEIAYLPIHFKEMIDDIFNQLYYLDNCALVKKDISIHEPVSFITDPVRLKVILNNLFSNSIRYADFSKPESIINVKVRVNIDEAIIIVRDNGMGIPEEHLEKVFNMYYRATEKNNGSGLGLYIVKETVGKLNGTIMIKSEEGVYTEITIVIPNYKG